MAGSILVVGVAGASAALAVGLAGVGAAAAFGQRMAAAADAAALAAADAASGAASGVPCERAAELAGSHGAELVRCELDELVATVTVTAHFARIPVLAQARAGPPP